MFPLDKVVVPVQFLAQGADRSNQIALPVIVLNHRNRLREQIHEGARFRLLDITEGFFHPIRTAQAQIHEVLIQLQLVIEKGDLQLFPAKTAAEGFECAPSTRIGVVRLWIVLFHASDLTEQKLRLIQQHG